MKAYLINMHLLVPNLQRSRSNIKVTFLKKWPFWGHSCFTNTSCFHNIYQSSQSLFVLWKGRIIWWSITTDKGKDDGYKYALTSPCYSNLGAELSLGTLTIHPCNGLNDKNLVKSRNMCFITIKMFPVWHIKVDKENILRSKKKYSLFNVEYFEN